MDAEMTRMEELNMIPDRKVSKGSPRVHWIDITLPIHNDMVCWPDDPPTVISRFRDAEKGDPVTMSQMSLISHVGTHIDAPLHFIAGGTTIDMMPLEIGIGPAIVIEIEDRESVKLDEVKRCRVKKGDRVLFKTINSSRAYETDDFVRDYVYITPEVAQYLGSKKVSLVGLDYISVGSIKQPSTISETHKKLLNQGVWILEGLNLKGVKAGHYQLVCLPLKLEKGDAGLARAILKAN
jgi:arylformamidase